MQTYEMTSTNQLNDLTRMVYTNQEPVVVKYESEECFVAMQPAVFERVLFETTVLDSTDRTSLHL